MSRELLYIMASMGRFHWITIFVAVLVLLIVLIYIGILMTHGNKASKIYPPIANICPDYWLSDISGYCVVPAHGSRNGPNTHLSSVTTSSSYTPGYNDTSGTVDFNSSLWVAGTQSVTCAKKTWCQKLGVYWDGVTNYNNCST